MKAAGIVETLRAIKIVRFVKLFNRLAHCIDPPSSNIGHSQHLYLLSFPVSITSPLHTSKMSSFRIYHPHPPVSASSPSPASLQLQSTTEAVAITSALNSSLQTFHLIHHRNKNQHRSQRWFRHLSTLRRNLRKLLCILEILSSPQNPPTGSKPLIFN